MGRWAQAKRRASAVPTWPSLGPPPKPTLDIAGDELTQYAQGGDDTGGWVRLYYSVNPFGPFVQVNANPWAAVAGWGFYYELDPGYYVGREEGNGVAYAGMSAMSETWHITG